MDAMEKINKQKFTVTKEDAGLRLDVFLSGNLPDFSRSWIQKLIEKGNVKVGSRKPSKNYRTKAGENVFVSIELPPEISLDADKSLNSKIKVVFENDDFLVINKSSGLVVHPSSTTPKGTIVNWLLYKYPEIKSVGDDPIRPGIVHRLDKETSGLMVIARNQKTFEWLKEQFKERNIGKKYLTLVIGDIKKESGEISYPIGRSKNDPTKQVVYKSKSVPSNAREAHTLWRVIKQYPDFTYLEVVPKTGRMHQIRVHLKSMGHPVAGDSKYATKTSSKSPRHIGRMFLHASFLSFTMPPSSTKESNVRGPPRIDRVETGERFSFNLPLPKELKDALKNLPFMLE